MPKGIWKNRKRESLSAEHKRKIGESRILLDYHPSDLTRQKMSIARKGKKFSDEWKRKMSKTRKELFNLGLLNLKKEKNPSWKGGITPLNRLIRTCFKYRQWRSDVFTRDDFRCVLCGQYGGVLNADHYPRSFSDIFQGNKITSLEQALTCEEFWNINNGRTLCRFCHRKTDTWGGVKKNKYISNE